MKINNEDLKLLTKDLRKHKPRPAADKLAGFSAAARCLDKCRATLLGQQGDFTFGCPMDQRFLDEAGLDQNEFKDFVATGASDEAVAKWIEKHARAAHLIS